MLEDEARDAPVAWARAAAVKACSSGLLIRALGGADTDANRQRSLDLRESAMLAEGQELSEYAKVPP